MALAHAVWIHGHSMQIEHPDRVDSVRRAGFYIRIDGKPGRDNWFHFAIPTPVIVNDYRLRAGSVLIRFRTGSVDASVRAVHVYDGERPIAGTMASTWPPSSGTLNHSTCRATPRQDGALASRLVLGLVWRACPTAI